jgi:hypothetical protein
VMKSVAFYQPEAGGFAPAINAEYAHVGIV